MADAWTRRKADIPQEGDERLRQKERILLPKEKYFDTSIQEMETIIFETNDEEEISNESAKDKEIQTIKEALDKGNKEMKWVALGLCKWKDGYLWHQGKIWIPNNEEIRTNLIRRHHDILEAGHGGTAKTKELVQRKYYWPNMRERIKQYVKSCDICQLRKVVRHVPYGLMKPNEAPNRPWKSISMDFITDLPLSEGADAILIVIDRLTKMAHLRPCTKDMDAKQFQEMSLREIFRLHGLPRDIITDRGSICTSDLWKETTKKLGIERRLSTAFHLQTDGQTERANSTLEQYLQPYVNSQQDDWKELLPMAEFAYNNGYQESTKHTPFFANYGTNPEYQAIRHLIQGRITSGEDMSQLHDTLQAEMTEAQIRHKEYYDAQRKPDPNLQQGDMVGLLPRNIRTTRPCKKLDYKKIQSFKILARIGTSAYKLDLPATMRIHNTFHISLLEHYNDNKLPSQLSEPPPPILIEGEPEYELEEIVDSRLHYNKLQYGAKWTGYEPEHDKTWYPADNFGNANLAKRNFHSGYPNKPHLDQTRRTGEWRRAGLCIADTEPGGSPSTPTEDTNPSGKLGNNDRLAGNDTDKPAIPLTFSLGRSGTKGKRARCTPLDGVLERQLLGARQRESGTRMVPQDIQCYAIRQEPAI